MDILDDAINFATEVHRGQTRKLSGIPYILHPMEVAAIIGTMTNEREVMAAGMLHDTIEDCGVDPLLIRDRFGSRVFALVQSETEDKMDHRPAEETWQERKADSLLMLKHAKDRGAKLLWLADKLSNLRSFYKERLAAGDTIWNVLHQKDPKMQRWYYATVAEYLYSDLKDEAAYREYTELIYKVFDLTPEEIRRLDDGARIRRDK